VGFAGDLAAHPLASQLVSILALDPRPAYQRGDAARTYGMEFGGHEVQWQVDDATARLQVIAIRKSENKGPE
jgi:hypothetical protein